MHALGMGLTNFEIWEVWSVIFSAIAYYSKALLPVIVSWPHLFFKTINFERWVSHGMECLNYYSSLAIYKTLARRQIFGLPSVSPW